MARSTSKTKNQETKHNALKKKKKKNINKKKNLLAFIVLSFCLVEAPP
jgi:hypothetical protein